jgi:hypothetical protein
MAIKKSLTKPLPFAHSPGGTPPIKTGKPMKKK